MNDNQNTIKQELFLVRNKQAEDVHKKKKDASPKQPLDPRADAWTKPTSSGPSKQSPAAPSTPSFSSTGSVPTKSSSSSPLLDTSQRPPRVVPPPKERPASKILFIGDSIVSSADVQKLE